MKPREQRGDELRPFADDAPTRAAFARWLEILTEAGVEVNPALRFLVGAVAAAQTALQDAHRARVKARDTRDRLRFAEAERRLSAGFLAALSRLDDAAGEAGKAEDVELPRAVAVGGGKVIPMPMRVREPKAPRCAGASTVRGRILTALTKHGRLTKDELRDRVRADDQTFLQALKALRAEGKVRTSGLGVKGNPRRYEVV